MVIKGLINIFGMVIKGMINISRVMTRALTRPELLINVFCCTCEDTPDHEHYKFENYTFRSEACVQA